MKSTAIYILVFLCIGTSLFAQDLPGSINMKEVPGGVFTMGSNSLLGSPDQQAAAPEHELTISPFSMSEAEITNDQYVEFLNSAFADGLVEINVGEQGPDNGKRLVQGTSASSYPGKTLYTLDGIRVMKDHDDGDGDGNPFTGVIEPENPLNIPYIGFDETRSQFYVKNPHDVNDFHWYNICTYKDYGTNPNTTIDPEKNDFEDWSGGGNLLSDELFGWTESDPSAATKLPTLEEVTGWPVTFIRWWGAQAFADYYGMTLPSEAQWEMAAKGGQNFIYAVHDGNDVNDANWNQANLKIATYHVRSAISGSANPFGLYNLAGNAWEWIADNYLAPYDTDVITDPLIEVAESTIRCWRGGSWNYHEATLQSAIRFFDDEDRGNDHFGFRIAGTASSTGLASVENRDSLHLFPNPATSSFTINLSNSDPQHVQVISIIGHVIWSQKVVGTSVVDVSTWPRGVYWIKANSQLKKIIVL